MYYFDLLNYKLIGFSIDKKKKNCKLTNFLFYKSVRNYYYTSICSRRINIGTSDDSFEIL